MNLIKKNIKKSILICKHDKTHFDDIRNKSGVLTKHLKKLNIQFDKSNIFSHFDLKTEELEISHLKCPTCEFETSDINNSSGIFTRHIINEHNISINDFCEKYPEYKSIWKHHFKLEENKKFLNKSSDNRIQCKICGKHFKKLTNKHLAKHNFTPTEYKNKYNLNSTCSNSTSKKQQKISSEFQFDQVIYRIKSNDITPLFTKETYNGVNIKCKYKFKCNKCEDIFEDHLDNGREIICRICNPKLKLKPNKKFETEVYEFIKSIGIYDIITSDRKLIYPKEIDIYIPSKKLAIECDGVYWHSELYKDKKYHIEKTNLLKKKNIRTIHLFDDEWYNNPDIIKSKLKQILNCNKNKKIYARKCDIKELSSKECSEFLINNHIQGKDSSQIKLGCFYNNKLVSVITFCTPRISLGYKNKINGQYELSRFCSDINLNVIGAAGKLLKYFIRNYLPSKIITYADLRFTDFDNNVYEKLNFKKISITSPNYFWCNSGKRYHRFKFTKQKLIKEGNDPNLTELEIMHKNKYYRVWDCGHLKYELDI